MTLHIHYTHQCAQCEAFYIPYHAVVACPRCGAQENEPFSDFILQAANSALYNQSASALFGHGESFVPGAWFSASLGDHILQLLFGVLEQHRLQKDDADALSFDQVARRAVDTMKWGNQEYLQEHFYQIALEVHQEIERKMRDDEMKK